MNDTTETGDCHYDYANKCDCSEDDKCGCTFPNNLAHDYSPGCFEEKEPLHPHMELTVGMAAPDFTAPAVLSDNTLVEHFNFYKYTRGKLAVLFFYPEDFSFTCPSELLMLNRELNAFSNATLAFWPFRRIQYTHIWLGKNCRRKKTASRT